jgi:superfamily II DNA or RNA helicase
LKLYINIIKTLYVKILIMNAKQKVNYIKKELCDILRAVNDGISDAIIYNSYEKYNRSMLDYIKSKDKIWIKGFVSLIDEHLENGADENLLRKELLTYKGLNKYILNHIIDTIFGEEIIENEDNNSDDEEYEPKKDIDGVKIEEVIQNFEWRKNQLDAIDRTIKQGFLSGIHNQIMGAGKTFIILHTISKHFKLYPNKKLYIITTNRQEILKDLFFDREGEIIENKKMSFKKNDIIDLDQFNIIVKLNFIKKEGEKEFKINNKIKDVKLSSSKPTIMIVNTDFLKALDKEECIDYEDTNIVIFDECHGVSAPKFHTLIKKIKYENKIPIIGFSATPLREKAEQKLLDIFSSTYDKDLKNKKLNIISNYDFIQAIKDDVILPPFYILCEVNQTLNGKIGKDNKDIMKQILNNTLEQAPYKKIIGWVKSIAHLKEYYKYIKQEFPQLSIYCSSYCDEQLKLLGYNTNWYEFTRKENNAILLCVNRGREGSDIMNLDVAIYLDIVKKRSLLVALQTSGRVLRKDKLNKKAHGLIIDSFVNMDGIQVEVMTAHKIINYYRQIFSLCDEEDQNYKNQKETYNEMISICQNLVYDEKKEEIILKIDDKEKHNMKFKLDLRTKTYDFTKLKIELGAIIDKMFNIEKKDKFDIIIDKIKNTKLIDIYTIDFWKQYDEIPNKDKLGIPLKGKDLYDDYKVFFDSKTWYDILDIDTKLWYRTINDCYNGLKNIYDGEIDDKLYFKALAKDEKLPIDPYEFYKLAGFKNIKETFNKKQNVSGMFH